ncbi:MAG: ribosome-associated translation inhibitor RaiA [Candidatus Krumholzibacteriota bacterium]|nr:ribosome-associated translation inhibitor RaiA [Candidatus Krumholzibacteriota bacterium]
MNLTTTARHFETDSILMEHIEERVYRLKRYFDQILNVDVIMSVEKFRHIAEINVHVNGHDFNAKEESNEMAVSIDKATKNLERQIKKFKQRLKASHQKTKRLENNIKPQELIIKADSIGSESGIEIMEPIAHDVRELSIEEAILSLKKSEIDFSLFKNSQTGKMNFVYKRSDGDFGVIDTS